MTVVQHMETGRINTLSALPFAISSYRQDRLTTVSTTGAPGHEPRQLSASVRNTRGHVHIFLPVHVKTNCHVHDSSHTSAYENVLNAQRSTRWQGTSSTKSVNRHIRMVCTSSGPQEEGTGSISRAEFNWMSVLYHNCAA
jgi:hypothetical protein